MSSDNIDSFGFTGTRKGMTEEQKKSFLYLITENPIDEFHHGMCIGADTDAHNIVRGFSSEISIVGHPPTNRSLFSDLQTDRRWHAEPYLDRNKRIVVCSNWLIATPDGNQEELRSGTWSTIRYARQLHIKHTIIFPNGKRLTVPY